MLHETCMQCGHRLSRHYVGDICHLCTSRNVQDRFIAIIAAMFCAAAIASVAGVILVNVMGWAA